jgi:hypothetical protein
VIAFLQVLQQGHGWGLAVFPLLAAAISLVFAAALARRLTAKWRPHESVWAIALLMYWLFGAVLNVPVLAAGEAYLLFRRRTYAHALLLALVAISVVAAIVVWTSRVTDVALVNALPLGTDAWRESRLPYHLRWLSWIGYVALVAGLVWSARVMGSNPELRSRTAGVLVIALGATVVAIGSGVGAGLNVVPLFAVGLAAGIAVMFWGFIMSSRPARRPTPQPSS